MKVTTDKNVFNGRDTITHEPVVIKKGRPTPVSKEYGKYICYEYGPNVKEKK